MVTVAFQAAIAVFSMSAGAFWMASAYGQAVLPRWQTSYPVTQSYRTAHQAKWNGRAALVASIAAIFQAVLFLYEMIPPRFG